MTARDLWPLYRVMVVFLFSISIQTCIFFYDFPSSGVVIADNRRLRLACLLLPLYFSRTDFVLSSDRLQLLHEPFTVILLSD